MTTTNSEGLGAFRFFFKQQNVSVQQQYNSTNILYLNVLCIVVSVGKFMDDTVDIGSTRFSLSVENEQADTRRDGQICLAKPNFRAGRGTRKFFPGQLIM